jgi:hypothetical protein
MKAAIYYNPGDIRVQEIETPHPGENGIVMSVET